MMHRRISITNQPAKFVMGSIPPEPSRLAVIFSLTIMSSFIT